MPAFAATWDRALLSWENWKDLSGSPDFELVGAWSDEVVALGDARTEVVQLAFVSTSLLQLVDARPHIGRLLTQIDDEGPSGVVVLSHATWLRHFGGDPGVLDQQIRVAPPGGREGAVLTIVGVLAREVTFPGDAPDLVTGIGEKVHIGRFASSLFLRTMARLAPGVSRSAASRSAEAAVRAVAGESRSARVIPAREDWAGRAGQSLRVLLVAALVLLVMACATSGGLLASEAKERTQEVALRSALGGVPSVILMQVALDYFVLAVSSALAGLAGSVWATRALLYVVSSNLPSSVNLHLDWQAGALAVAVSASTTVVVGLAPLGVLRSVRPAEVLSSVGRGPASARTRGQRAVVAATLGLTLALLGSSAVIADALLLATRQPLGFDPTNLAIMRFSLTETPTIGLPPSARPSNPLPNEVPALVDAAIARSRNGWIHTAGAIERLAAVPGVVAAAGVTAAPLTGVRNNTTLAATVGGRRAEHTVQLQTVTERYFEVIGMPVLVGRSLEARDRTGAGAAVVSKDLERRLFSGNALGQTLEQQAARYVVVGVVPDVPRDDLVGEVVPTAYILERSSGRLNHFIVRTTGDPHTVLPGLRAALLEFDSHFVIRSTTTAQTLVGLSFARHRSLALVTGFFAIGALALAGVGVYALMTAQVVARRHEFAIRAALGAVPIDLVSLVARDVAAMVILALTVGLPAAYVAAQGSASLLTGVPSPSAATFLVPTLLVLLAALGGAVGPALAASRSRAGAVVRP